MTSLQVPLTVRNAVKDSQISVGTSSAIGTFIAVSLEQMEPVDLSHCIEVTFLCVRACETFRCLLIGSDSLLTYPLNDMADGTALIIVGINRGGTSAVASSLNALGIFLGNKSNSPVFEDRDLSTAFRKRDWKNLKAIAGKYASAHDVYAWKLPDTRYHLKRIEKTFGKVRFIFVFRDICAISLRKEQSLEEHATESMFDSLRSYSKIIRFAKKTHSEHLFVSYEKLLATPEVYASNLLDFLGYDASDENIRKITDVISVSPREYNVWADKNQQMRCLEKQFCLNGQLHQVDSNIIYGWARWLEQDDDVCLTLLVDGKEVSTFAANTFQQHLINSRFSASGNRGFRIRSPIDLKRGMEVAVIEKSSRAHLAGSPVKIEQ